MVSANEVDSKSCKKRITNECGIIFSLGLYGIVQERIMTIPYGDALVTSSVFLVLINRVVGILYACVMVQYKGEPFSPSAPLWKYTIISFSNVGASTCQYEALRYVSFPVQILGKSFKMMPVMLWSILISGKRYRIVDWLVACGVSAGVVTFLLTGDINARNAARTSSIYGLLLMLVFLSCDGFTTTSQEKLFRDHKTSTFNQMLYVNICSACVSLFSLVASGSLPGAIKFSAAHPIFLAHASGLSVTAVTAQFFIYSHIKLYGALAFAATMNTRQVFSVLFSYYLYGHAVTVPQVLGLALVFGSLFCKVGTKMRAQKQSKSQPANILAAYSREGASSADVSVAEVRPLKKYSGEDCTADLEMQDKTISSIESLRQGVEASSAGEAFPLTVAPEEDENSDEEVDIHSSIAGCSKNVDQPSMRCASSAA